jgi:hypothetical protein
MDDNVLQLSECELVEKKVGPRAFLAFGVPPPNKEKVFSKVSLRALERSGEQGLSSSFCAMVILV